MGKCDFLGRCAEDAVGGSSVRHPERKQLEMFPFVGRNMNPAMSGWPIRSSSICSILIPNGYIHPYYFITGRLVRI